MKLMQERPDLLLGAAIWINSKMNLLHEALNHADSVRALSLRIISLLHHNGGNIPKLTRQQRFPFFPSDLKLPLLQNLEQPDNKFNSQPSHVTSLCFNLFFHLTSKQICNWSSVPKAATKSFDLARTAFETLE